jgi:hypothetical protein
VSLETLVDLLGLRCQANYFKIFADSALAYSNEIKAQEPSPMEIQGYRGKE